MSNAVPLILALISQHPDVVAGLLSFVVLGLINGLLPTKVNGNIVTRVVSVLVDRLSPLTRKDARATLKWPLFSASVLRDVADAIDPPTPPSNSQSGRAQLGALVVLLVVAGGGTGALLTGCPSPRLPAVEGCTVRATRCHNDRPQVCSSTGRWHDVGDLACAASGAVCVEGDAGVAHCGVALPANPFTDGGAHE